MNFKFKTPNFLHSTFDFGKSSSSVQPKPCSHPMKPSPLRRLLTQRKQAAPAAAATTPELQRAQALLAAVDAGGIPLYPAKVNQIARDLGLAVSREEPVEATIARIRQQLAALGPSA